MRKIVILLTFFLSIALLTEAKDKNEEETLNYQIEGAGQQGQRSLVKVTIVAKKKNNVNEDLLAKCAVHGVLFRGYTDTTASGYGDSASHPSIMGSPMSEHQHADFFKPFFLNADYMGYVHFIEDSRQSTKVGKQYKVSAVVSVATVQLKKDLKKAGILKGLNSGW